MKRPTVPARTLAFALAPVLTFVAAGCGPTTRDYGIVVRNQGVRPMTLVLTKDGPPMENDWLPPEDIAAMLHVPADMKLNRLVLQPGQTADQVRRGKFDAGTNAVLRVYAGDKEFEDILGVGPDSPERFDLPLAPGPNRVTIDKGGKAARE